MKKQAIIKVDATTALDGLIIDSMESDSKTDAPSIASVKEYVNGKFPTSAENIKIDDIYRLSDILEAARFVLYEDEETITYGNFEEWRTFQSSQKGE